MTVTWDYHEDGSFSMASANVQGQNYTSSVSLFDTSVVSNGTLAVREMVSNNGGETIRGYEAGLTFVKDAGGARVMLPGSGEDAFHFAFKAETIITGGGANTNFVFGAGFGNVTITDFVAHSLPNSDNDVITFGPGLFQDFADLRNHMSENTKTGTTTITDHGGNTLVLSHTVIAQLTANDFILL
jgi:hypothetical protein